MSLGWEPAGPSGPLALEWQRLAAEWAQTAVRDPMVLDATALALRQFVALARLWNQAAALVLACAPGGS